jgi:hypothetical protein
MRLETVVFAASVALAAGVVQGQTTGIPFVNDYTITCVGCTAAPTGCWSSGNPGGLGGVSGSTSCTPLFFNLSAGGTFTFTVTTTPGAFVTMFTSPCLCTPCWLPLTPICPYPLTACGGITNQSVDLNVGCGLNTLFSGVAVGRVVSVTITVGPLPPGACIQLGTQAAITGSIACAGPVIVTQAYSLFAG